jgi:hypothetical protein
MRSQLRFVMHPGDERDFVSELLRDESVVLINGPRWKTSRPEVHRSLDAIDDWYCIIWSRTDLPELDAEFMPRCNDWYCRSQGGTIQFLRSRLIASVLLEGRLAINTDSQPPERAEAVERRYRNLRKFVQRRYRKGVLRWRNPRLPSPSPVDRSANPSKPDTSLWLGPAAAQWLQEDPTTRRVKQQVSAVVEAEFAVDAQTETPQSGRR